jgi:hypothetical protein
MVHECVKCGADTPDGATSCSRCTWPFSPDAWSASTLRIRRITIDTGCINVKGKNAALNTLEQWARDGRLELQRSDAMLGELIGEVRVEKASAMDEHPGLFTLDKSVLNGPDVLAGPDLGPDIQNVLFPTAHSLTDNQLHDIEHLRLHVLTGGDVFVTLNRNDFITRGRQDILRACGIWVMEPVELVDLLKMLYEWE